MSLDKIKSVIDRIRYKDWQFRVDRNMHNTPYLQLIFFADGEEQRCRKWLLSYHMGTDEIVRTAWKAVLAAEEHEAAEKFLYRDQIIFNPHFDPDALAEFAACGNIQTRDDGTGEKIILIGDKRIRITMTENNVYAGLILNDR